MEDSSEWVFEILACPYCGGSLSKTDNGVTCSACHEEYVYSNDLTENSDKGVKRGPLDLRLRRNKPISTFFELCVDHTPKTSSLFSVLERKASPEVDYTDIIRKRVPEHLSKELLTHFPKAKERSSVMLDLGCGDANHREVCEHAGFRYIGLDYSSPKAQILGDAHALPFKSNSFELILSIAVLEHIRYPFIMMQQAYRVMKPGGKFIGSVAFLEPFHGDSYYHHTHLGTLNWLQMAGFDVERIAPSTKWSVLVAQSRMGLFPGLPTLLCDALVMPLYILHRLWWKASYCITTSDKATETHRRLSTAGSFAFVASKGKHDHLPPCGSTRARHNTSSRLLES